MIINRMINATAESAKWNQVNSHIGRINTVFGDNTVVQRTVQEWFQRSSDDELGVEDFALWGRPSAVDNDR